MTEPESSLLKIAIMDRSSVAPVLKAIFQEISPVASVSLFEKANEVLRALEQDEVNTLAIDIFTTGVTDGLNLISTIREEFPYAPICLLGDRDALVELPDVPDAWRKRFDHYYMLAKDDAPDQLIRRSEGMVKLLEAYLRSNKAYVGLLRLRNMIVHREGGFDQLPVETASAIEKVLAEGERALETKHESIAQSQLVIQGFGGDDIKLLVKDTLEKASKALDGTARVNKWILICGAGLVLGSFVVASFTQRWEAVTFGGFGIAGIIASLITNPLKSIGVGAKRLVILQVAYLNFLKQLSLFDSSSQDKISVIDKSRQLNEGMEKVLEHLDRHFG